MKVSGVIVNPGSFHGSTAICVTGDCALVGVGKSKGSLVGNSPCGMNVVEREVLGRKLSEWRPLCSFGEHEPKIPQNYDSNPYRCHELFDLPVLL